MASCLSTSFTCCQSSLWPSRSEKERDLCELAWCYSICPRARHSGYGLSQWGTMLQCNVASHWQRPYPEWSLDKSLIVWSREVSKRRDWQFIVSLWDLTSYATAVIQRQHRCRDTCQIWKQSHNVKRKFEDFDTLQNILMVTETTLVHSKPFDNLLQKCFLRTLCEDAWKMATISWWYFDMPFEFAISNISTSFAEDRSTLLISGLVPNRQLAITWANDDQVPHRVDASSEFSYNYNFNITIACLLKTNLFFQRSI